VKVRFIDQCSFVCIQVSDTVLTQLITSAIASVLLFFELKKKKMAKELEIFIKQVDKTVVKRSFEDIYIHEDIHGNREKSFNF
jgi:hypothetical protein